MSKHNNKISIDHNEVSYSCCIVWGYLPGITTVLPFIGHMGITDSKGVIHDFVGDGCISRNNFMTGPVLRYLKLDVDDCEKFDEAVKNGSIF
mmetsp:Transcript_30409/g.25669  ORF Transcript_30409/g.25669 Transcript_30409/m.25669 type:complete len:92 (-) Transcript_30409:276-551(-)